MAGWIIQCILVMNYSWIISLGYHYDPAYSDEDSHEYAREYRAPQPISRIDHFEETVRHQRTSERTHQRANERSIPFTSDVQRVQEQERRRVESRVMDAGRVENGSPKIVNHPKHNLSSRHGAADPSKNKDNIFFPGPTQRPPEIHRRLMPLDVPEKCKLQGICEDVPDYPQDVVDSLLSKIGNVSLSSRFNIDELQPTEITQRIGAPEEVELCNFQEKLVVPRAAPDRSGKWFYIVNQKERPVQAFRVEICDTANSPCSEQAQVPFNYDTYCKQKYTLRRMSAVGPNNEIIEDSFAIPSCCSCVLKPNTSYRKK